MVAIEINGTINTYREIPSRWNGIINYNSVNNTDMQYADGWRDVVFPDIDARTEKRGAIYFDSENDVFTYQIVAKTQAEIDAYDQAQLDADEHATKVNQRREDGDLYYYRVMTIIERAWRNGQVSNAIASAANSYFDDALEPILRGNWQAANVKLAVPPVTSNTPYLNVYNTVKTYVTDYVAQTYSKNQP